LGGDRMVVGSLAGKVKKGVSFQQKLPTIIRTRHF